MLNLLIGNPFGKVALAVLSIALSVVAFWIWLGFHDQQVAKEAREGYVLLSEKIAAETAAAELRRQIDAANKARDSFKARLDEDAKADAMREKEREDEILGYELRLSQANRACALDRSDIEFLRKH